MVYIQCLYSCHLVLPSSSHAAYAWLGLVWLCCSATSVVDFGFLGALFFRLRRYRLVEDQPIEAELAHGLGEAIEIDRLANVAIGAQFIAIDPVFLLIG